MEDDAHLMNAVSEFNRAYVRLAQRLLLADRDHGKLLLGISDETADVIIALTPEHVDRLADGRALVCRFRSDMPIGRG
ncbi:flagellar transcriptional activator FlhD [Burkholderia multivorans]